MNDIIKRTQEFLYSHLKESNDTMEEIKYRYEHSLRVANIGLSLANSEGANQKIVTIGCLLHDVGKFDTVENIEHGRVSARVAREFLSTLSLSENEVNDICYAISVHVDGKCGYEYEDTLEAKIVSDADNIDRFGAYRIYQQMNWDIKNSNRDLDQEKDNIKTRIKRLQKYYESNVLETESGNNWFEKQLELQIEFYKRYLNELEKTVSPILK